MRYVYSYSRGAGDDVYFLRMKKPDRFRAKISKRLEDGRKRASTGLWSSQDGGQPELMNMRREPLLMTNGGCLMKSGRTGGTCKATLQKGDIT
jgi:hypothetical protein